MSSPLTAEGGPSGRRLMIPGPTEMPPEVTEALSRPAVAHYGEDWLREHDEVIDLLAKAFVTETEPALLVGAGTAGIEAGAATLLPPGERVAVGVNGAFGDRLAAVMESMGFDVIPVVAPWGQGLTRTHLARTLDQAGDVSLVAVVHGETSTGVLNPVEELADEAYARGAFILVDAISSFGGAHLPVDEWQIDLCVGAPQKCLGAAPGVCPMTVSDRAWARMEETAREVSRPGWCLNLLTWRKCVHERALWEPYPVTIPCALVLALKEALRLLLDEGPEERFGRMERLARAFRAGIRALGCETIADECWASPTVTAVVLPDGVSGLKAREFLRDETGCIVGFGAADYRDRGFRVGHFGATANWDSTARLLRGVAEFLQRQGFDVGQKAAVTAAQTILEAGETS